MCPKCNGKIRLVPGETHQYQCDYCEWYGEERGTQPNHQPKRKRGRK